MKKNIGYLYLFITFFIWGSIYVVSKFALDVMAPFMVLLLRYLVSVLCLAVLLRIRGTRKPVKRGHWRYILIVGALGYFVSIGCQVMGTNLLDASLASLINAMNPVSISILAVIFLGEKVHGKDVVSIIVSLVGVYIILGTGGGNISIYGVIASVCSVLLWSTASVVIRKISSEYDPVQVALYGMAIALLLNIPAAGIEAVSVSSTFTAKAVLSCVYLGVVGTAVAHTLWNVSLKLLDASVCSMFYPLQPLTSAVLGIFLLGEVITWNFVFGGLLICGGVLITVLAGNKKKA